MSYEELSLNGFINEMKQVSSGPHSRKFCFVLGAGASKTSGIKSGQELVNIWDKELLERNKEEHLKWRNKLGITDANKSSFYSQYYERRFRRNPADGFNYLEKLMEHAKPSIGYVMLSYLLTQTNNNVVITTNFDHLAEDAVNYYSQTIPLIIGHESLSHYISRQVNRPTIVKIHRDLLFDPKNRTEELEKLHDNWEKALDTIFSEYHPIFIGYAGNDKSLMNFLNENSEKFLNDTWKFPYWMIYKSDTMAEAVQEFIEKADGYLIKHDGFDKVLYLLGATFDYKLPSKEVFLSDAERRFQMLTNSIDDFTEKSIAKKETAQGEDSLDETETEEINQAIQQVTDQAELQSMYREAVILNNDHNYEEALKLKKRLVELAPENALYHYSLSVTLYQLKRYEEALEASRKALEAEPYNQEYISFRGVILHEMKRYEEAVQAARKALEFDPDNARYLNNMGIALHEMGCYEEALEASRRALELDPDNARYYSCIGVALYQLKRYEEALEASRKALEFDPDTAIYHYNLSMTLYKMLHYEEAIQEMQKAIELDKDNVKYQDSLNWMQASKEG